MGSNCSPCCATLCPTKKIEAPQPKFFHKKIVVVGPASVGKTTFIQQLMLGETKDVVASIKAGLYKKNYKETINGIESQLTLNIWDTPGGDQFGNLRDNDYLNADACIMVYAIDKESSYEGMKTCHTRAM